MSSDTIVVFKPTHDDWYGNFPNNEVRLKYHGRITYTSEDIEPVYRVSAWGNDDHAMVFDTNDEDKAKKMFNDLVEAEFIDKDDLDRLGFSVF